MTLLSRALYYTYFSAPCVLNLLYVFFALYVLELDHNRIVADQ